MVPQLEHAACVQPWRRAKSSFSPKKCPVLDTQPVTVFKLAASGESGSDARPMHPDWARSLRDQCAAADVPYLFKQWGEWHPSSEHDPASHKQVDSAAIHINGKTEYRPLEAFGLTRTPGWAGMCYVGKKAAGRLLDGVQHDGYPA